MAAPTVVAVGTITTYNSFSASTVDISWPTHQADDIGICVVVGKNYDFTPPSGWTKITFSGYGTPESTTALSIGLYWKRATSSSETAFQVPTTYAAVGRITTVRGCPTSGSPVDVFQSQNDAGAGGSTTYSVNGVTTTVADDLALYFCGARLGTGFTFSNWTAPGSVSNWVDQGEGGNTARRVCEGTGTKATSGATGSATANASVTLNGWSATTVALLAATTQQYNQALTTNAVNTSETLTKSAGKPFTIGLTLSATIARALAWALTLTSTIVSTLETLLKSRALTLTSTAGKTPTPTLTKANVWARTVSAAVGKSASYVRAVGKRFTLTQFTQFPTGIGKGWGKSLTATQVTVSSLVKGAAQLVTLARTIGFNATVTRGVARTFLAPGATVGAISKAVTARLSALVFSGSSIIRGLAMAISAGVTSASFLGRTLVRLLVTTVNAPVDFALQVGKTFALTMTLVPRLLRALSQRLFAGVAVTAAFILAKGLILTATRATTTTLGRSFIKATILAVALAQPTVLVRSITARLSAAGATTATLLRSISARLTAAAQGASATILRMRGKLITATATTTGAIVKRVSMAWAMTISVLERITAGRPLLMVASAVTSASSLARTYARTLTATVGRTATQLLSRSKLLLAASASTASRILQARRAMVTSTTALAADALAVGKRLVLSVTTAAALSRVLGLARTLAATATTTATIARLLARYGLLVASSSTTSTIRLAAGKVLSTVGYGTALLAGAARHLQALTASVAKAAGLVKAVGKPWALALTSTATFRRAIAWTIGFLASPAPTIRRAVGLVRLAAEPLAAQLLRSISVRLTAAVGRAASIVARFAGRIAAKPGRYVIGIWHKRRAQR